MENLNYHNNNTPLVIPLDSIESRKQLREHLEGVMTKTYEELKENQELEYTDYLLKTYVIESNQGSIPHLPPINGYDFQLKETRDKTLYILRARQNNNQQDANQEGTFYIDTYNPRFWYVHTAEKSSFTDNLLSKIITSEMNGLDNPWLSAGFLESIGRGETFRGFSMKFDDEFIVDEEGNVPLKNLSMRLWGNAATKVINHLKQEKDLRHALALSGVSTKTYFEKNFVLEDIFYNGKFTVKGTSIDGHFHIVNKIVNHYEENINEIEDNCAISYEKDERGYRFSGSPISIIFKKKIENLEFFLDQLFSSKKPFRLWGVRKKLSKDYVKVGAVDLHTGHTLNIEISNEWARVYLPRNSCGNTFLRLFTNLQQHYDSEAKVEGLEHERVI